MFSKGTTLIVRASDPLEGSSIEMSVNPDGSLMWLEAQPTATYVMKCMRVDRCWEMSAADFGDLKWHLMGPGWVTYRQGADFWAYWIDGSWPTGTTYDVSTGADGSQTFVATYAPPGGSVVESTTVSAGAVSDVVLATLSDGTVIGHLTMEMRSQPDRVVVTPPARRSLDGPAIEPTSWEALINS